MPESALLIAAVGAVALGVALLLIAVAPIRSPTRGVARAVASIEHGYGASAPSRPRRRQQRTDLPEWPRRVALLLSPSGTATKMQRRLDHAGNPGGWTPDRVLAAKGLGLLGGGVLVALLAVAAAHGIVALLVGMAVGAVAGFFLPDLLLYNLALRRQQRVQRAIPDALDMLTVCVEAGLGFDSALAQVARNTKGPLAEEFARALQEIQIGQARADALRGILTRTNVAELRAFIGAVVQAGELGVPIARVLREQASEMRVRRRQRAEERAQKVPVKITFPLITCLFPALLVVVIGPGILRIAHAMFGLRFGVGPVFP